MNPARHFYEELHKLNLPKLGPYINNQALTEIQCKQFLNLQATCSELIQVELNLNTMDFTRGEVFVSSPWHAWALLTILHSNLIKVDGHLWNTLDNFIIPAYRGHEDSSYKIIPSLYRGNNQETDQRYLDVFTLIFNQPFLWQNLGVSLPLESVKAAAQHYCIKTNLLDITADPAIAVYFACHSNSKNHAKTAAVLIFDLQNILSDTKIILPPPIVERLYKQRGAFLSFPTTSLTFSKNIIKITFPPDPDFQIIMDDKRIDILETDPWFERAVNKSKEWIDHGNSFPNTQEKIDNFIFNIFESIGYPVIFQNQDPMFILAHWIDQFEDIINWYAIRMKDNKEGLLTGVCQNIAHNNPEIIKLAINAYDALSKGDKHKNKLRDFWHAILTNTK